LPLRLSELAILVTAARWRSQAEWHIHHPIALEAGVPAATADAIRRGVKPAFESDDDALIHAFATELYDTQRVSDATFARARALRPRDGRQSGRAARLLRAGRDDAQHVRYARRRTN
jgi:4-carboxymuconolactone decarboxylase